jgi:hypothetical protein
LFRRLVDDLVVIRLQADADAKTAVFLWHVFSLVLYRNLCSNPSC